MKIASLFRGAKIALAFFWIASLSSAAAAETLSLSLTQALSMARERNPAIDVSRERITAAEGMHKQAGLIPNPTLTATSENEPFGTSPGFSFGNQTDDYIYASQIVELGGKRGRRAAAAKAGVEASGLEAEITARQVAASVASSYWAADGADTVRELYRSEAEVFARMVEYSGGRVREGATANVDLLRIQLEHDRMLVSANAAATDADRTRIALYHEMGASDFPPEVNFTDSLEHVEQLTTPSIEVVLRQRPEMQLANTRLKQAQANLALERANAYPDPDLMFGYKRWSGYNQFTGLNTMFFGVKAPLPLFNRNQGKIASADAELRIAKRNLSAQEMTIRAEVASASSEYLRSRDALERILPAMSDRAGRNQDITSQAYRIGGSDLLRYLDAERVRLETRVMYVRALAQHHQSAVRLEYATGTLQ